MVGFLELKVLGFRLLGIRVYYHNVMATCMAKALETPG